MARRVCILGLGQSGIVVARHALEHADDVTVYAGASSEATRRAAEEFTERGVPVLFDDEHVHGRYDLCVACPGIPATSAFYQSACAASDELIAEPEYAWRLSPRDWIAVSGTNGKTTTAALVAHVLEACGKGATLCGNTQAMTTTQAALEREPESALVAELSSYQLASTREFSPRVAVLLNITSDHLAWHGSWEAYAQAKLKLFSNLAAGAWAVIDDDVPDCGQLVDSLETAGVRVVTVGSKRAGRCAYLAVDSTLRLVDADGEEHVLCPRGKLGLKGDHNVRNALAAASAAVGFGCEPADVGAALCTFAALSHRIEFAGSVDGVDFYDDSKATNVDATLKALTAFAPGSVVLMLGGLDKHTDLAGLVGACEGACAAVVCYGQAAGRFCEAFSGAAVRCERAEGMREAFALACACAHVGQVVLLSPACASFDEFSGFSERGQCFKQLVAMRLHGGA